MTEISLDTNHDNNREFRTVTASTKVTDQELVQLESAAAGRGVRLGEWIRDVLLRAARSPSGAPEVDPVMTEIVALQMFLTSVFSFVACGERMSADRYQELMRNVKANKHRTTRDVVAQYAVEGGEESHG
jgi:hypothetical protein